MSVWMGVNNIGEAAGTVPDTTKAKTAIKSIFSSKFIFSTLLYLFTNAR